MPLVFKDLLRCGENPPDGAINLRVVIRSKCLSERYRLEDGDTVIGEICEVLDWFGKTVKELRGLIGYRVKFILKKFFDYDCLYISKESWKDLKDFINTDRYVIKVKISLAESKGRLIKIYPEREKVAELI